MGRRKANVWADWVPPGEKAEGESSAAAGLLALDAPPSPADAPEPAEKTILVPLFPMGGTPFTPESECPHWCKRCRRSGVIGIDDAGKPIECPDCFDEKTGMGTGQSRPDGDFVCMTCYRAGKDGSPALPNNVEPLPPGPSVAEQRASRRAELRERAKLEAYIKKGLRILGGSPP